MRPISLHESWAGVVVAIVATALLTALLSPFREEVGILNQGLLFLLLTLLIASVWGRNVGLFAAFTSNLALNFFFIDPLHTFAVEELRNVVALVIFLIVSIVSGSLLLAARRAAADAYRQQAETEVVLTLSRAISGQTEPQEALQALCREVVKAFDSPGAAVLTAAGRSWSVLAYAGVDASARAPDAGERNAADQAAQEGSVQSLGRTGFNRTRARVVAPAGRETAYERSVALVPLKVGDDVLGVLRLDGPIGDTPFREHPEQLLSAVASEAALALQRAELAREAAHAKALREADEMKTALIASISHDLRTPLAAIKAAISNILDQSIHWSEDDLRSFHQAIDSQADRLNRVIGDILDLNRIESGALTGEQNPVLAADLLRNAREVTRFETEGREVTLQAPEDLTLLTDEALIEQAVVNLIENAVKYSTPGAAIHLKAASVADEVELSVEDEGPGIATEDLPYVFERFYRSGEHSGRVKGSGLGLTIVKGFVELCGGSVSVESSARGTRFMIRLPAAEVAPVQV